MEPSSALETFDEDQIFNRLSGQKFENEPPKVPFRTGRRTIE
jgi:hypothetical protein